MHGGFHSPHHSISPHSLACTLSPPSLGQADPADPRGGRISPSAGTAPSKHPDQRSCAWTCSGVVEQDGGRKRPLPLENATQNVALRAPQSPPLPAPLLRPPPSPCPLGKRRSVLPLPRPGVFENIYKDLIVGRQNGISFPFTFQGSPNPSPLVQKHTGKGFLFCLIRFKGIFVWG